MAADDSTVVIKVKYGDILRRFRARVIDGEFSLTMYELRKMIFSLFGFSPDKEIMLTYIDEDGDVATFVDFLDLRDVVKQGINPIRFTVNPIPENDATKICGSSKPLNLPSENDAIKFHSNGITEAVDNLPKAQPVITNSGISEATMGNDSWKAASSSNGCTNTIVSGKEKNSAYTSAANLDYRYPCCGTSASCWGDYCDICGMYPKTVYRFISKGICTICFKEFEKEINKMDKDIAKHKLDCCFIEDVSVAEGSIVPPSTRFTKTWRMRNIGFDVWPEKTRLVWAGGHKLSHKLSFELRIPATGLPVWHDLDISVDFTSPKIKGYYTSYWIMKSPSGEQFGERIWIYIQVDDALNLNFPSKGSSTYYPKIKSAEAKSLHELRNSKKRAEVVRKDAVGIQQMDHEADRWAEREW